MKNQLEWARNYYKHCRAFKDLDSPEAWLYDLAKAIIADAEGK